MYYGKYNNFTMKKNRRIYKRTKEKNIKKVIMEVINVNIIINKEKREPDEITIRGNKTEGIKGYRIKTK